MYEPRTYREIMGKGRFSSLSLSYYETDLWIGINPIIPTDNLKQFCINNIIKYRNDIYQYASIEKQFFSSLAPLPLNNNAAQIICDMLSVAQITNTGPMSSVAGAFSQYIAYDIINTFKPNELIIENGGDIFLYFKDDISIAVYAGNSPLSQKVGITIPMSFSPLGVCTSSGTIGHSFSYGKADAVMIACKNTLLADAYATAFCNKIQTADDIQKVLDEINSIPEILSAIIIVNDKMGITGQFDLKLF